MTAKRLPYRFWKVTFFVSGSLFFAPYVLTMIIHGRWQPAGFLLNDVWLTVTAVPMALSLAVLEYRVGAKYVSANTSAMGIIFCAILTSQTILGFDLTYTSVSMMLYGAGRSDPSHWLLLPGLSTLIPGFSVTVALIVRSFLPWRHPTLGAPRWTRAALLIGLFLSLTVGFEVATGQISPSLVVASAGGLPLLIVMLRAEIEVCRYAFRSGRRSLSLLPLVVVPFQIMICFLALIRYNSETDSWLLALLSMPGLIWLVGMATGVHLVYVRMIPSKMEHTHLKAWWWLPLLGVMGTVVLLIAWMAFGLI